MTYPDAPVSPLERLEDFKRARQELVGWIDDELWLASLSRDIWLSDDLMQDAMTVSAKLADRSLDRESLDKLLMFLHEKSTSHLNLSVEATLSLEMWRLARIAYAYYALGEVITDGSKFSEGVLSDLARDLGSDYLSDLAQIDRQNPSGLTNITDIETSPKELTKSSAAIPLYLVLKQWQDRQHVYHEDVIYPHFSHARSTFEKAVEETFPNLSELSAANALIDIDVFYVSRPLDLSYVTSCVSSGLVSDQMFRACFGGKALGLSKLADVGARLPDTHVIPANILRTSVTQYLPFVTEKDLWAVRSSATIEDGSSAAFAGIFESILRVPSNQILPAFDKVIASANSDRAENYIAAMGTSQPHMAVVLQKFTEPKAAGVWLGESELAGILEWVDGDGEKLVSGRVTPHQESWSQSSVPDLALVAGHKAVGEECLLMQTRVGGNADFEFCIVNQDLVWLQYRPVTRSLVTLQSAQNETAGNENDLIQGRPASGGIYEGWARMLNDPTEEFPRGDILICDVTDPDWLRVMREASAIVTAEGGALCHAAITARELGKPCVVGAGSSVLELNNTQLLVNGFNGQIKVLACREES